MNKKIFLSFFVLLLLSFFKEDINANQSEEPIEIYADEGIEWHKNEKKYVAIGNAKATQGTLSLKSFKVSHISLSKISVRLLKT